MIWNCFCVGAGGFAGAVLRYIMSWIHISERTQFPLLTFIINVTGALVIGIVSQMAVKYGLGDSRWILFLKTGVCGGFTTFSTFALESCNLISSGRSAMAVCYMVCSVTACLGAVFAGQMMVRA